MTLGELSILIGVLYTVIEVLGVMSALHAVTWSRTPQGAIAWFFPLVILPFPTVFLYWVFGRSRFYGYVSSRRAGNLGINHVTQQLSEYQPEFGATLEGDEQRFKVLEQLASMPFTVPNQSELLIDGDATFESIFAGIDAAQHYVLVQFFIVRDDELGCALKDRLVRRSREGVRVYFLYDEIGSHSLSTAYVHELTEAGVQVNAFHSTRGSWWNQFQLNFRNHRKVVITDGNTAWVGGHNVGDEYVGRSKFGRWRDTHVKLTGPSVTCVQLSFLEDWYWATHEIPELRWKPQPALNGDEKTLVVPTGPADELETCGLLFVSAIHSARKRLWIASPYFVPDIQVMSALQLAALRGVDVRVMLPQKPDHVLVYLSSFSYIEEAEAAGVQIYRYRDGFLHQKTMLIDDDFAAVGTANLDNRSFRLNFEITVVSTGRGLVEAVADMFTDDFSHCNEVDLKDLREKPYWFQVLVRLARLMAPIQ